MRVKRGDTIVEVSFSIAIFSLVAILTLQLMNRNLGNAQANLEVTMARNEINAQSEAIRYIHNAYLSERELEVACDSSSSNSGGYCQTYRELWNSITSRAVAANQAPSLNTDDCAKVYNPYNASSTPYGILNSGFVVNTRNIDPSNVNSTIQKASTGVTLFRATSTYPRIVYGRGSSTTDTVLYGDATYNDVRSIEGLWIMAVKSGQNYSGTGNSAGTNVSNLPEYYDFHIYTCWYAPSRKNATTIGTIVRLYNPEIVERARV